MLFKLLGAIIDESINAPTPRVVKVAPRNFPAIIVHEDLSCGSEIVLRYVSRESFDSGKLKVAKGLFDDVRSYSSADVHKCLTLFTFDDARNQLIEHLAHELKHIGYTARIDFLDTFTFPSNRTRARIALKL
jgi:hypothetical protein